MSEKKFILVHLDDDPLELRRFSREIVKSDRENCFDIYSYSTVKTFNDEIKNIKRIDFFILDIYFANDLNQTGISLVAELRNLHPNAVILMSSNLDDPQSILQSLRAGADEFLSKKVKPSNIIEKILDIRRSSFLKRGIVSTQKQEKLLSEEISFTGKTMQKIALRVPQIISSAILSVYIEGESGTGKEVVADMFSHYGSPFVKMNCGSISPSLLESELFGYKKGAFTGALNDKEGLIEAASGGWLFLDEVASLSANAQTALLRVLENQEVIRLGESHARKISVRFIAASNIPLSECVQKKLFRNDLWQRLCETEIKLPPLRERESEIPDLILFFCKTMRGGPYQIEQTALDVLCKLPWNEGNIRELRNCLRAMTEHHNHGILTPMGIPERILLRSYSEEPKLSIIQDKKMSYMINEDVIFINTKNKMGHDHTFKELCECLLHEYVLLFSRKKFNLSQIAKKIGIARSTLQLKSKKWL